MRRRIPRIPLAIYRLKPPTAEHRDVFDDVIDDDHAADVEEVAVRLGGEARARLFTKHNDPAYPGWAKFLAEVAPDIWGKLAKNAANSAVLVVHQRGVRYALTFGYGRSIISPKIIERDFGLRCALALIDPTSMLSVGYKEVDHTTLFANLQANRRVRFDEFHVDTEAAILSGIVGQPEAPHAYYTRVLGSDALHLNPAIKGLDLPDFLNWLEKVYQDRGYVDMGYEWIDHVLIVRDNRELDELRAVVDGALRRRSRKIEVGPPEPIDYEHVEAFRIVGDGRGVSHSEVTLTDIARARGVRALSIDDVQDARVRAVNDAGTVIKQWSAFDWLTWSGKIRGQAYVLQAGVFYRIERTFEKRVDRGLARLKALPRDWPDWNVTAGNEAEESYNQLLADHLGERAKLLDKVEFSKTFQGKGKLELCDVFLRAKKSEPAWLICVKKYAGSSAPLSHLFAQGMNSISTLANDEDFRAEIRDADLEADVPEDTPAADAFGLAYLILTNETRTSITELPFFAKLSLFRHAKEARQRGLALRVGTRAMKHAAAAVGVRRRGPRRAAAAAVAEAAVL